ncbi:unnamed protein product [Spodoptera littoralis]|uniref:NADH dehydrogenase [ubiquinone] flavoprotein 3, mitochondrial n=1 Tax=Spodoptera littoralis TaxID=7109 RepID=A0A9P0I3S0_SPOLI|nr:unnamed protein product [Spodoptera littoralis]CAH1639656.1 unnamed protein product [Spodoptera littoralis]
MAVISELVRRVIVAGVIPKVNVLRYSNGLNDVTMRFQSSCSSDDSDSNKDPNPGSPSLYDCRKLGHNLSANNVCPLFKTLENIPTGVFRNSTGEILGRGAGKCCHYKNPEYYSYHHMSFYDLNLALRQYRKTSPSTDRKPNVYRPPC